MVSQFFFFFVEDTITPIKLDPVALLYSFDDTHSAINKK